MWKRCDRDGACLLRCEIPAQCARMPSYLIRFGSAPLPPDDAGHLTVVPQHPLHPLCVGRPRACTACPRVRLADSWRRRASLYWRCAEETRGHDDAWTSHTASRVGAPANIRMPLQLCFCCVVVMWSAIPDLAGAVCSSIAKGWASPDGVGGPASLANPRYKFVFRERGMSHLHTC